MALSSCSSDTASVRDCPSYALLPAEIIQRIATSCPEDLASFRQVCKHWHAATRSFSWKKPAPFHVYFTIDKVQFSNNSASSASILSVVVSEWIFGAQRSISTSDSAVTTNADLATALPVAMVFEQNENGELVPRKHESSTNVADVLQIAGKKKFNPARALDFFLTTGESLFLQQSPKQSQDDMNELCAKISHAVRSFYAEPGFIIPKSSSFLYRHEIVPALPNESLTSIVPRYYFLELFAEFEGAFDEDGTENCWKGITLFILFQCAHGSANGPLHGEVYVADESSLEIIRPLFKFHKLSAYLTGQVIQLTLSDLRSSQHSTALFLLPTVRIDQHIQVSLTEIIHQLPTLDIFTDSLLPKPLPLPPSDDSYSLDSFPRESDLDGYSLALQGLLGTEEDFSTTSFLVSAVPRLTYCSFRSRLHRV